MLAKSYKQNDIHMMEIGPQKTNANIPFKEYKEEINQPTHPKI